VIHNRAAFSSIGDGDLVCLTGDQLLDDFLPNFLPLYEGSDVAFIVFTWIRPRSFPSELGGGHRLDELLESEHILHIFCVDYDGTRSPKLSAVPLGLDYHSKIYKYRLGLPSHPRTQEAELNELVADSLAADRYHRRQIKVFRDDMNNPRILQWEPQSKRVVDGYLKYIAATNTSFDALFRGANSSLRDRLSDVVGDWPSDQQSLSVLRRNIARWAAFYGINGSLVETERERKSPSQLYALRSEYAFVLSPFGGGLDCYRMWEALAFGHIVITLESPLDALYQGLPVVSVKEWGEITESKLKEWYERYFFNGTAQNNEVVRAKLTTTHWVHHMKSIRNW